MMNDTDFIDAEIEVKNLVEEFKEACEESGMDFFDRIADIVFELTGRDLDRE